VDDSFVCRAALREILEAEGDIEVVAEAADGTAALDVLAASRVDLVTMDLEMPGVGGLQVIERIMSSTPVPILVVTGRPRMDGGDWVFESLRRGALDLAEKPPGGVTKAAAALRAQVRELARVPVVRHVAPPRGPTTGPPSDPSGLRNVGVPGRVVGIAASAGGPNAVAAVLAGLPRQFSGSVALVQHLPVGFARSFVGFLRQRTSLRIVLVDAPVAREPGTVYVAADDRHLVASGARFAPSDAPAVGGFRPSATTLFTSLADAFGAHAIGVVLSGMGSDGTAGLAVMRARGALTIAQDEATSRVFGMPRAAIEAGAAELSLPLSSIAATVLDPSARAASRKATP
jgi:two-component system chemotaxis response regulator CheB